MTDVEKNDIKQIVNYQLFNTNGGMSTIIEETIIAALDRYDVTIMHGDQRVPKTPLERYLELFFDDIWYKSLSGDKAGKDKLQDLKNWLLDFDERLKQLEDKKESVANGSV